MLPEKAINEFQKIYKDQIGVNLPFDAAQKEAENFIQLFDLVTKNEDDNEKLKSSLRAESNI